jgi:aminoglycoside/choline kinase family phosphotransferase
MSQKTEPTGSPGTPPAPLHTPIDWADPQREALFHHWLDEIAPRRGLLPATVHLASADASFRRYFRLDAQDGTSRIVMDAPPDMEDSEPFVRIAALMEQAGLRVPQVLEWDARGGFLLLGDLGAQTMMALIDPARPQANTPAYRQAVDTLITWQLASRPGVLPPYDAAVLQRELALFPDWYLVRHRGVAIDDAMRKTLDQTFATIVAYNLEAPSVFVHRDFMPRNLMVPTGTDARPGVLDFQDALYGPITYDIASLMRDAFLSWEEDFVIDVTVRYWQEAKKAGLLGANSATGWGDDFGGFYRAVEWMGLQRHLKVAGIFARLTLRDGKPKYLADTPRFIAYIRATAGRYRELTPLLRLVDKVEGTQAVTGFAYGRV